MGSADFEWDSAAMADLLRSDEVLARVDRSAAAIAAAAGPGMRHSSIRGRRRALAMVWTDTIEAMVAEAKDRRLTRAIDAGRR